MKRPALQVEQVKMGCFGGIYEDNVWKLKPTSNDQSWKFEVEYLFFWWGGDNLPHPTLRSLPKTQGGALKAL